ncbi:VTT domain-containing protein [Spirillospora sp. NPDC046719]
MPLALDPLDAPPGVLAAAAAGAPLGAQTGYLTGHRAGRVLLSHSRNRRLRQGAERAETLPGCYGHGKATVLARFIPAVRTVLNPLAGMAQVPARTFVVGSLLPPALEGPRARTALEPTRD